ncbi:hypothetical protein ACTACB_03695 [Pseudomonas syringae]|uniref:hypothetical protein n=1 Tax=Pseudomonas syringae TaxID=317 RepID=UPI003F776118
MEEQEHQRCIALQIAVEAGTLQECENHDGTFYADSDDVDESIELGKKKFASGELEGSFSSANEVEEAIRSAYQENCGDGCYSCERWADDD